MICQNCLSAVFAITSSLIWCLITAQSLSPQRFAIEPTDKTAIVGDTVILPCRVSNKVGTLQWTRDGFGLGTDRVLNGFPRYTMIGSDEEGDYSLQISSVALEDDAQFQCQVGAAEGIRGIRSRSAQFTIFVPPEPPVIVQAKAQGDHLRTTSGMTVELTCEAHAGKPPAEITWLDGDGNTVSKGIEYTTHRLSDGKRHNAASKWTFTASKEFDGKTLTCRSENSALKSPAKAAIRVEVKYAPEVQLKSSRALIHTGDDVELVCAARGNPKLLLYKWFINDEAVSGDHSTKMVLRKIGRESNGAVVTCEVSNSVGTSKAKHTLNVAYGPSFKTPVNSVHGGESGQDVKLRCDVDGNPKPDITWLMLGASNVLSTGPELLIKNLSATNVGKYVCRASIKGFDEISKQIMLFLKGPPRFKRPFTQYGINGEEVRVECLIESVPPPTKILWHHNSQTVDVDNNQGYEIIEEPVLGESTLRSMIVIRKSKLSDFGSYNCSVWNQYGFDSRIITLVQETNFSPLVLTVGIIICCVVFVVASTIVIILCMKRKSPNDDTDSYHNDVKKGGQTASNHHSSSVANNAGPKHHNTMDSGSSGADSDIKVEIRTASSLSQHWDDTNEASSEPTVNTEIAQVVDNIYSYTNQSEPVFPPNHDIHAANNGYIPYCDYNRDYLPPPTIQQSNNHNIVNNHNHHNNNNNLNHNANHIAVSPTHSQHAAIIVSSMLPSDRGSYIDPTYGTIMDSRYCRAVNVGYANPYLRTSSQSSIPPNNSNHSNAPQQSTQLSAGMYSANANPRYITSNSSSPNSQLATHV